MQRHELKVGETYEYVGSDTFYRHTYIPTSFVYEGPHRVSYHDASCSAVRKDNGQRTSGIKVWCFNLQAITSITNIQSLAVERVGTCSGHTLLHHGCQCGSK